MRLVFLWGLSRVNSALLVFGAGSRYRQVEPMSTMIVRPLGSRRRRPLLWASREVFYSDARLFILGAAGAYSVNLVGALPGDEVLLFLFLPILLLTHGKRAFDR